MKGTCYLRTSASLSSSFYLSRPSRVSRFVSCAVCCIAVYRDGRCRNLPSDRHAVNEHVDRSRFPRSSCMACQIVITAATAIDIAHGPTARSCLPGEKNETVRFCSCNSVWPVSEKKNTTSSGLVISSKNRKRWKRSKCFLRAFKCPLSTINFLYNRERRQYRYRIISFIFRVISLSNNDRNFKSL